MPQSYEPTALLEAIKDLELLQSKTEKLFADISPEELVAQEEGGGDNMSIEHQRRQNLANKCNKLSLRTHALKMAIGATFLSKLCKAEERPQVQQKVNLIYGRLMDIVLKIDCVANMDSGDDFLNLETLNTELRLTQKYDKIKPLFEGDAVA